MSLVEKKYKKTKEKLGLFIMQKKKLKKNWTMTLFALHIMDPTEIPLLPLPKIKGPFSIFGYNSSFRD
jgi:hypothetical protein